MRTLSAAAFDLIVNFDCGLLRGERLAQSVDEFRSLLHVATPPAVPPQFVYLAGPILGCSVEAANGWRNYAALMLRPHNIIGISPLRCEPIHGTTYGAEYVEDPRFGTGRAIAAKNKLDVRKCDLTLAVLPNPDVGGRGSYGTLQEIAWADQAGKMSIIVTDDPAVIRHPVIDSAPGWKLCAGKGQRYATIQEALTAGLEVCIGVLGGYAGGKNV